MKLHSSILIIFLTLSVCSEAQLFSEYNFKFKNYTSKDGLVHNFTRKCRMDSKGFLWIITQNGLSRFDGYTFKNFQHIPGDSTSLPFNDLLDMDIDSKDRIWLGYPTGLCYYDQVKKEFFRISKADQAHSLVYDKRSDIIWYNSMEKGLNKVLLNSMEVRPSRLNKPYDFIPFCMSIDSRRHLWIGIERLTALCYDIAADTFYNTNDHSWARSFNEDEEGNMWVSTWGRTLTCVNKNNERSYYQLPVEMGGVNPLFHGVAQSTPLTGKNILWVVSHTSGLALFDKKEKRFIKSIRYNPSIRSGPLNDYNSSIYADRNGIIWVCNWFGLSKINQQEQQFHSAEMPELKTDLFNLFAGMQDDPYDSTIAWLVVPTLGTAKYDKSKEKIIQWYYDFYKDYDWVWPMCLIKDKANRLWAPTYGGVISIERGKVQKHEIKWKDRFTYAEGAIVANDGKIWLWSEEGLIRFDPDHLTYDIFRNNDTANGKSSTNYFKQIQQAGKNSILVTSEKGLYRFDISSSAFTRLDIPGYSNRFRVLQIIGEYAYVGGEDGLFKYHIASGKAERLGEKESIINLNDATLLKDNNDKLWIYALNGLFRYDPVENKFKKFTSADGIYNISNDRSALFSYNNNIYIGYRMAYTSFDPARVDVNNNKVIPFITDTRISNTSINMSPDSFSTSSLRLHHKRNNISFDYTGIDYTNSERITFAYQLEGYDKDWIQAGTQRMISYSNLPGGSYTFKVKACNSSGIWNEEPAIFKFYIIPPLLQRWWFKLLIAVMIAGILYFLYKQRIRQIKKRQLERSKTQQLELEQYKQQLELEQIVNFFSGSLADKNTREEIIWDVASNLIHKLGFANCMIYLWNEDKTLLLQKAGYGPNGSLEEVIKEPFNVKPWQGIVGHVAATKKPILLADTRKDPRYRSDVLSRLSELCVPALYNGELISVIDSEDYAPDYYKPQHLQVLTTIATLMAARLVSIETTEDARRKKEELDKINSHVTQLELENYKQQLELEQVSNFFSISLVSKNNSQEVMDDVAKNLIGQLGFEDCMIYLWDKEKTKLIQYAGHGTKGAVEDIGNTDNYNIPAGKGIIGSAVASKKTLIVNDVTTDPRYFTADGIIRGSEMCVPLIDDGEVIGAINIEQTEKGFFNDHHQHIVSTIASMMVSKLKAIKSTQSLYQKELELSQTSRQLAETELAMLRSQMNPHFIFNSLNSVQKYIWENKEEDAAEYLAQFAKLMRAILENSRKNFVTLREEINTMKIYTELEHRRSNGRFNYTIRIAEDIDADKVTIPPLILQPFIENAVWHGLSKKNEKGNLTISVHKENDQLVCIVDDDGVGRAEQKETSTGKRSLGIEITRQRIESLMQSSGRRPSIVITDKKQNGNPAGTKVTITLPLQTI